MSQTTPSNSQLEGSRQTTLLALARIDDSTLLQLSRLTLPEIQAIKQEIAQVLPVGNLPAFVLSGLLKLKGRTVNPRQVNQDIATLLRGMSLIPQGVYGVLIAGPAAVLYAYQKLLQLSGKDASTAFPYGTWQFYLQFGLREDAARHANETSGFHKSIGLRADPASMAAAWICAALELLYRFDDLLAADWTERVMLRLALEQAAEAGLAERLPFATLARDWNRLRPYHSPLDGVDYVAHRSATWQAFFVERLNALPDTARKRVQRRYTERLTEELSAYQEQMTLLATLEPDRYQENKESLSLWQANLAFIWQGHTYLLPACQPGEHGGPLCYPSSLTDTPPTPLYSLEGELCDAARQPLAADRSGRVWRQNSGRLLGRLRPPAPEAIKGWVAAILSSPAGEPSSLDVWLAASPRSAQKQLREKPPAPAQAELAALRRAPIVVNWDESPRALPLAYIRRNHRGIGDHALTIFRTEGSFVFDQSHIFFDGLWGLAIAEILTDSAVHWQRRLASVIARPTSAPTPLVLSGSDVFAGVQPLPQRSEAAAESGDVDTRHLFRLRKWLRQRGVAMTVNDVLLLYRCFHAASYRPSPSVRQALDDFSRRAASPEAEAALKSIEVTLARFRETNPALLIPMDASNVSPGERIFPTTFRNPLVEIRDKFNAAREQYRVFRQYPDAEHWSSVDQSRRELLAYLGAFGQVLDTVKAVTMRGESFNTATLRLLGHLPASMQYALDQIPQRIGFLNEIIKGNEVFSNVGRVAPGTSLARFISAKDDGQAKDLIWGILTDDQDRMHISLRDFRPFVPLLIALGETALADALAQDYLNSYVAGLNRFVAELNTLIALQAPA